MNHEQGQGNYPVKTFHTFKDIHKLLYYVQDACERKLQISICVNNVGEWEVSIIGDLQ